MTDVAARARSRIVVALAAVLSAIAIGVLWPLTRPYEICPAIYPAPPGCDGSPLVAPFAGITLVLLLLAAAIVVFFTVRNPWLALVVLSAGIVVVTVFAVGVSLAGQGGGWTVIPEPPPVFEE